MDGSQVAGLIMASLGLLLTSLGLPPIARRIWKRTASRSDGTELLDLEAGGRDVKAAAADPSTEKINKILKTVTNIHETIEDEGWDVYRHLRQTNTLMANLKSDLEKVGGVMRDTSSRMRADEDNAEERQHPLAASSTSIQPSTRPLSSPQDNATESQDSPSIPSTSTQPIIQTPLILAHPETSFMRIPQNPH